MHFLKIVKSDIFENALLENLLIYFENLSFFYVICAVISILAVWFTWNIEPSTETKEEVRESESSNESFVDQDSNDSLSSNVFDKKVLMKSIKNSLTSDDRVKEIEIEKKQLKDILEVMKNDEKFRSITLEDLQEQLKLYRD